MPGSPSYWGWIGPSLVWGRARARSSSCSPGPSRLELGTRLIRAARVLRGEAEPGRAVRRERRGRSPPPPDPTVEGDVRAIRSYLRLFDKLGLLPAGDDHRRVLAVVTYLPRT